LTEMSVRVTELMIAETGKIQTVDSARTKMTDMTAFAIQDLPRSTIQLKLAKSFAKIIMSVRLQEPISILAIKTRIVPTLMDHSRASVNMVILDQDKTVTVQILTSVKPWELPLALTQTRNVNLTMVDTIVHVSRDTKNLAENVSIGTSARTTQTNARSTQTATTRWADTRARATASMKATEKRASCARQTAAGGMTKGPRRARSRQTEIAPK
jgi:hypothetical protein